jgi:hypothetical protein
MTPSSAGHGTVASRFAITRARALAGLLPEN